MARTMQDGTGIEKNLCFSRKLIKVKNSEGWLASEGGLTDYSRITNLIWFLKIDWGEEFRKLISKWRRFNRVFRNYKLVMINLNNISNHFTLLNNSKAIRLCLVYLWSSLTASMSTTCLTFSIRSSLFVLYFHCNIIPFKFFHIVQMYKMLKLRCKSHKNFFSCLLMCILVAQGHASIFLYST